MPLPITVTSCSIYFLPVQTRTPYKFGAQVLSEVTCIRTCVEIADTNGKTAKGWGETPLNVQWAWPGEGDPSVRLAAMKRFCVALGEAMVDYDGRGHPIELGFRFQREAFHDLRRRPEYAASGDMTYLAGLVCLSAFDIATHDAYGQLLGLPVYQTYGPEHLGSDLASFLEPAAATAVSFADRYPSDFLSRSALRQVPAWHAVGAGDPITQTDLKGDEPDDAYPLTLDDWIRRDGLNCLKIKLSGANFEYDFQRIVEIGALAETHSCDWLCADFNCTVKDVSFITEILKRLLLEAPRTFQRILYVEQPFLYSMEQSPRDVRAASAMKPLFMDESAHDWELVREGRNRGWTGVALKTCKTQTNAILMQAWARAHEMPIMVQDLTNPMLAQIPHLQLAAHAGTIMGLETNSMQYYPDASLPEAQVHPGVYQRVNGVLDTSTLIGPGFGYRVNEIGRSLPEEE